MVCKNLKINRMQETFAYTDLFEDYVYTPHAGDNETLLQAHMEKLK
jgi:hypothetical protein